MERDLIRHCAECGIDFVWTMTEQAFDPQSAAGPLPDRCPGCRRLAPAAGRQRGLVKWYSRGRGYGFITPAAGPEVFVHKSALADEALSLRAGQLVEFGVSHGPRGIQAERVVVLEGDEGTKIEDEGPRTKEGRG